MLLIIEVEQNSTQPEATALVDTYSTHTAIPHGLTFEHWQDGKAPTTITKPRPSITFACTVPECNKLFNRKGELTRHLKSHESGPRTHDCLAESCTRKGTEGFWRMDKLKDHLDRKHPDIDYERWFYGWFTSVVGGYRDVTKRGEHEALMRSKGYKPYHWAGEVYFKKVDA
ncbi:MAG: hypothetical protein Q9209_005742 [Squamulea sp. 1 TL-2023]